MFKKLINKIKNFFTAIKIKRKYRVGSLVFQPETLMYYIVEAHVDGLMMMIDEYRMIVPVEASKVEANYIKVSSVKCPENMIEYKVGSVDIQYYTVELQDRGFVTLTDLNEGNF